MRKARPDAARTSQRMASPVRKRASRKETCQMMVWKA